MRAAAFLLALLALPGCVAAGVDTGRVPQVEVITSSRRVPLKADGTSDPRALADALAALGGDTAVDADITGLSPRASASARAALVGAGLDPARVRVAPPGAGTPGLLLTSAHAVVPSCGQALQADWLGEAASSLDSIGPITMPRASAATARAGRSLGA